MSDRTAYNVDFIDMHSNLIYIKQNVNN